MPAYLKSLPLVSEIEFLVPLMEESTSVKKFFLNSEKLL